MTLQEYRKVFEQLDDGSKIVLELALIELKKDFERGDAHYRRILEDMHTALATPAPKYQPVSATVEYFLDLNEGRLTRKTRFDEERDASALIMAFLNEHVVAGEWRIVKSKTKTSEDRAWTTYIAERVSKASKGKKEAPPVDPTTAILAASKTMSRADLKKLLADLEKDT
jgi:predicted component of type VI protein secretion system